MMAGVIVAPVLGAVLAFLLGRRRASWGGIAGAAATTACVLLFLSETWATGPVELALGGWSPPLGIAFRADGLALLMLGMTAVIGALLSLFAFYYFRHDAASDSARALFWPLWLLLWAGLNGVFLAGDIFSIYILIEIILLTGASLITLAGTRTATVAALRYLIAAMTGSLAYLLGVGLLYNLYGTLDLALLSNAYGGESGAAIALLLMVLGLMVKAALFPLHFWLPAAHAAAPAPASAILSAVVIKAAFVVLLRLWSVLPEGALPPLAAQAIGGLAAAGILWGSIQAVRQRRLKMVIAYSTVAQIGVFFLVFPALASSSAPAAWAGGAIQATAHALAKAGLFLAAGIVILARGSDELEATRGLLKRLPLTAVTLALGGLALYGLPGSGGALGKDLLAAAGPWWLVATVKASGFLTLAYVVAMLRFFPRREVSDLACHAVPLALQAIPFALVSASLLLAWPDEWLLQLLARTSP